jgi:hypothetical protein
MTAMLFGPVAIWFSVPALVGTAFFTLRTVVMLVGGDADSGAGGVDVDVDATDVDSLTETGEEGDSAFAFKVLSMQAISAFLMGFGWGGLGALLGSGLAPVTSVAVGLVAGAGMTWLLAKSLRFVYGLQSTGNLPMYRALEVEGSVYAQIPAVGEGRGEVRVVIDDRERYYRATTDGRALPTGARVRVIGINEDDNSVTVTEA